MKKERREEIEKKKLKTGKDNQVSQKKLEKTTERRLERNKNKKEQWSYRVTITS